MEVNTRQNAGPGCLILFGLVFLLAGVGVMVTGVRGVMNDKKDAGVAIVGGFAFFAVGGLIAGGSVFGARKVRQQESRKTQFPTEPWKWDPQSSSGEILDQTGSAAAGLWFFALLWNAIAFPVGLIVPFAKQNEHNNAKWIAMVFPLIGILLLIAAIRQTMLRRKFGVSSLKLGEMPARPGSVVAGTVTVAAPLETSEGVAVRLYCVHRRTSGSGKNRSTHESTLWEDELPAATAVRQGTTTQIPFRFTLPPSAPQTDKRDSDDQRFWRLTVRSPQPGLDYDTRFEIPVFAIEGATDAPPVAVEPPAAIPEPAITKPTERGVTANRRIDGGWDIHFAAGRNKGGAGVVALIGSIFGGVAIGLGYFAGEILFTAIFSLIAILCFVGLWQMLFAQTSITLSRGTIKVRKWSPVYNSTKEWSADQIENVTFKITSQFGDKPYYSIRIHPKASNDVSAGSGISSKRDAHWIVDRLREGLHLSTTAEVEEISTR